MVLIARSLVEKNVLLYQYLPGVCCGRGQVKGEHLYRLRPVPGLLQAVKRYHG